MSTPREKIDEMLGLQPSTPADPSAWNLNQAHTQVNKWYQKQFGKPLPVHVYGLNEGHRRMGFKYHDAMDVGVSPASAEGQALSGYLKSQNIPFSAWSGPAKNKAGQVVSTGTHFHIGPPGSRTRTGPKTSPSRPSRDDIDAALGLSPTGDTDKPTYDVALLPDSSTSNEAQNPATPTPKEPQQFLKSPDMAESANKISSSSPTPVAPDTAPTYKPPTPPASAKPASELAGGDSYDAPLKPFDKELGGALGVIGNAGPEAQAGYIDWVRRNATGKHEASLTDESYAQTFIKIQQYLGANPKATPEETVKELAKYGQDFVSDPATKGKQLPKTLHDAMLRAPYSEDELKTLPSKIRQQREQIARSERQRQQEAALQKQTIDLYRKNPEQLNRNIAWHFGEETLKGIANLPEKVQRHVALMAVAAANEDERKRQSGQSDFQQDANYQAVMRKKAGVTDDLLQAANIPSEAMKTTQAATSAPADLKTRIRTQVEDEIAGNLAAAQSGRGYPTTAEQVKTNLSESTRSEIELETAKRLTEQPTEAERTQAQPEIERLEKANYFWRQWERGTPEIASFIHKAQATLGRDLSKVMPGGVSARLKTLADQSESQGRVEDLIAQHEYSGDQTLLRGIGKEVVQQAFSLTPLIASEAATGIPFPVLMAGQSYLENGNKPATTRLIMAGGAYLMGKAYQKVPGLTVEGLQKIPGAVGNLATKYPGVASRIVGAGEFGGIGAGETLARGGTAKQAVISGVAQAIPGAVLAGRPEESTEVSDARKESVLESGRPSDQPYNASADESRSVGGRSEPSGVRESSKSAETTRAEAAQTPKAEDVPRQQTVAREDIDKAIGFSSEHRAKVEQASQPAKFPTLREVNSHLENLSHDEYMAYENAKRDDPIFTAAQESYFTNPRELRKYNEAETEFANRYFASRPAGEGQVASPLVSQPQSIGSAIPKDANLTEASQNGSIIYFEFDAMKPVPTAEQMKAALSTEGATADVVRYESNITSGARGTVRFRADVYDENGRMSSRSAEKVYQRVFGTKDRISGKTTLSGILTPEEQFKLGVNVSKVRDLGESINDPRQPAPPLVSEGAEQSKVLAHIAGPSGAGKTELVNKLGESVKNIDLVDLDIFDEQAVKALGWRDKPKNDYTDTMLDQVHAKRQELIDDYIKKSDKPIVFFGHHIEGDNVTDLPTEDRYLLNVNPTKAALNASRRPGKTAEQVKEDIAIGKRDVSKLKGLGYEPLSSRAVFSKVKAMSDALSPTQGEAKPKPAVSPTGETESIARVKTSDLALDPSRFQYKLNKDAKGSTGSLSGVEKWNDEFAGLIQVWRDPADGKTYIVNGHNRYNKAVDTSQGEVNVQYIKADSAKEARAAGALSNIASGDGTPMDAAQFFRDSGKGADDLKRLGISLQSDVAKKGLALSNLNDFVFNAVRRGELPEDQGIAIGAKVKNPDLQNQAFKALAKAAEKKTLSKGVVDEILDAVTAAPRETQTEQTLFGAFDTEKSLFTERAQVSAAIKRMLTGDKSLFGTAARRSERLAEGGTQVDVEKAKELQDTATEALGIFDTLKNRSGKVSDILDAGARKVASGDRPDKIAKESYEQIKQAVNETLGRGVEKGVERGAAPSEPPSREEGARGVAGEPEEGLKFGPGAANVGDVPAANTMSQLSEVIGKLPKGSRARETTRAALDAADKVSQGKDVIVRGLARMKAIGESVLTRPIVSDYKRALGDFLYAAQKSDHETRQFAKQIKKQVPSKLRREAITNFIQAGGDPAVLAQRASASKLRLRLGYEEAQRLTDEEKTIATNIMSYYDSRWQEAHEAGILNGVIENYVNQAWSRRNPITDKLMADVQRGLLEPNFKHARQRVFESFFEGEQAGYKPLTKDIGSLLSMYNQSLDRAIFSRQFILSLHDSTAADGRPLVEISGSGMAVPKGEEPPQQYTIRPHTKQPDLMESVRRKKAGEPALDLSDYRSVDHPALRGWKWLTNAISPKVTEGELDINPQTDAPKKEYTPIYMKGDMIVHPEEYEHLKNVLGRSWFSGPSNLQAVARGVKRVQTTIKGTMFSLSGFHQVQEAVHALGHRVNPITGTVKLDFDDPTQSLLVKRGLQVASFDSLQEFGEGLTGGNLTNKIPVLGSRVFQPYQEWLFRDYIPRLKMTMALDALERNTKRYSKSLSTDQIAEMTAEQSNAAFGELNYRYMGRNPTLQDVYRVFLLAPDFLEARGRFVGQAIKPEITPTAEGGKKLQYHGREQLAALGLLAVTQYTSSRILNKLLNGDYHWEPENAFRIMYGKRWFGVRTVPADIAHLISDPRGFAYHRLSPLAVAGVTGITGRDDRGQKLDAADQIKNFLKSPEPIILKRHTDDAWWESFANSMGLQEGRYYTPAEEVIRDYYNEKFPGGFPKSSDPERAELKKQLLKKERAGQDTEDEILRLADEGKLSRDDVKSLFKKGQLDSLQSSFIPLPLSVAVTAFEKADKDQREKLQPLLQKKMKSGLKKLPAAERDALRERIDKALE